jgi:hypothetical protein
MAFEKDGQQIKEALKHLILADLFQHIIETAKQKPEKIIADIDFFNKEKKNRFVLNEYSITPIDSYNETTSIPKKKIIFSRIADDKEYETIKIDASKLLIEIEHTNSRFSEELQALDLISGSIFSKIENNESSYYNKLHRNKLKIRGAKFHRGDK